MKSRRWFKSVLLLGVVIVFGVVLAAWKHSAMQDRQAASANQPEPIEVVTAAVARPLDHRATTTSIGTVLALRSITLRNEVAGTVSQSRLTSGQIVEAGALLVLLDVSVEEAELKAQEAQAALAKTILTRRQHLSRDLATAEEEVDRARADLQVATAQIARTKAISARKTIRAPFRARVGLADVHPGQYLNEGTQLTTLQGVDAAVHVDFTVAQQVATGLRVGDDVEVLTAGSSSPALARIVALDSRIDPATRNALVRARIDGAPNAPSPGTSVRVQVPVGLSRKAVAVPASAVRKGPGGEQVFVLTSGEDGKTRAYLRTVGSGAILGDEVVILTGLSAGERVAAAGAFKLRDAVQVAIANDHGSDRATGVAIKQP
jgi:membrane fusion protein (multidrug efflux system)